MSTKFELKTPKGTRDYGPTEMACREKVFGVITDVFKKHGAVTIDTPIFELKEVLTGKYGEDSKLIYDLRDQGGELCSLRYDLTVPFARYLAMNKSIKQMKRYQIGKVYRRDQPVMTKGRYREFYQCDIDFAGQFESMVPDAELLSIISDVLTQLDLGKFTIKVNHRKLLNSIFTVSGVPADKMRPICSAVDKLDKNSWEAVRKEMVEEKGLDPEAADRIWSYVQLKGSLDLVERLSQDPDLLNTESGGEALKEMRSLFGFLDALRVKNVVFDLSLARGLDYYTGMIVETILDSADGVGSIAGGGRYDDLVNMFSGGNHAIPCVGFSFGIERIFSIIESRSKQSPLALKASPIQVLVASVGDNMLEHRMRICSLLWEAGVPAEFLYKRKPKLLDQFEHCEKNAIPLVLVIGESELAEKQFKLKRIADRNDKGVLYPMDALVSTVKSLLRAEQTGEAGGSTQVASVFSSLKL